MRHLSPSVLLDIAEGKPALAPHLEACQSCRLKVAQLRQTLARVAEVEVPEPSPLYWDRLSARVREAVAAQELGPRAWWRPEWVSWRAAALSGAALALCVAVVFSSGARGRPPSAAPRLAAPESESAAVDGAREAAEDPSLGLLADVAVDVNWDEVRDAGLVVRGESVDGALSELSDGERAEMRRLLRQEMVVPGV